MNSRFLIAGSGWESRYIRGWMVEWMDGHLDRWMDKWMNEWIDRWMFGVDGWMGELDRYIDG